MKLLDQISELKSQGKTVEEIAKTLNLPTWFVAALYDIAK